MRISEDGIYKITNIDFEKFEILDANYITHVFDDLEDMENYIQNKIVKHSFNIIDLIEKDDYINGCRVYEVEEQGVTTYQQTECSDIDYNWIHKSEIKDIVTKEQFNFIKYEVK